ncbi:MAG: hypothetical protein MUC83_17420 [Pirellula sp.]|nr:hypothetical protein [Pirellula sp.]
MNNRYVWFAIMLIVSWGVMTFTHEMGHIVGGLCCGGSIKSASVVPWSIPYSIFEPDPMPLVTLWSGLLAGALMPVLVAVVINNASAWFVAHFCMLANGIYVAIAWVTGDRYLDTARLLEHGASPWSIAIYCCATITIGYIGFRNSCFRILSPKQSLDESKSRP